MDKNFINKFLKGSAATSVGTFASIALHFISISLMARFASKEAFGLYFLIFAIANGGKIIASLGLDLALVQFLVSEDDETQQYTFAAVMWLRIGVLVIMSVLVLLFGSLLLRQFDNQLLSYQIVLPILFSLMSIRELFFYILQGLERYRLYALIQTVSAFVKLTLIIVFRNSLDLSALITIEFVMLISSLVMQAFFTPFKQLVPPKMLFEWQTLPKVINFALPLYANSIFTYISNSGAVFIVGYFLTPISIAAYEAARKIPEGFQRLFNSFRVVYFPSLSSLFAKDDLDSARLFMNKSLVLLGVIVFGVVLGGLLFSREIVLLVFSDKYLNIQPAFVLLLFAVCMHLLSTTMGYSLVSAGHPRQSTIVNVISMSIELGLSLLFIPFAGYIGAALSYIIMVLISQILCFYYLHRADAPVKIIQYIKPYLLLAIPALIYLQVGNELFLWRVGLFLSYIALAFFFVQECRDAFTYLWRLWSDKKVKPVTEGVLS